MSQELYLKCPGCGNNTFREWARQLTFQGNVRLFSENGNVDYEDADCIEFSEDFETEGYECEECQRDFVLKNNNLVEA